MATLDQARAAKSKVFDLCRARARVVGVGIAKVSDGYGLKVNLEEPPLPGVVLPAVVDDVPVRVTVVGKVRKQSPGERKNYT